MAYLKIEVALKGVSKRVYRDFYVKDDILLEEFGIKVLSTFNVQFEHCFLFSLGAKKEYVLPEWLEEYPDFYAGTYKGMKLLDMPRDDKNRFVLEYDTGEGYEFNVTISDEKIDKITSKENMVCIGGRGEGIFENDRYLLTLFLKLNSMEKALAHCSDGEEHYHTPYNTSMDDSSTTKEYFEPLDLDYINERMECDYNSYMDQSSNN